MSVQTSETSMKAADRRQAPRTKLVDIAYIGMGPENGGLVLDVSDGGLSLHAVAPVQRTEKIKFLLSLRGHSRIEGTGEVVWTNSMGTVCGLKFTSLSVGAIEHLNNWTNQSRLARTSRTTDMAARSKVEAPPAEIVPAADNAGRSLLNSSPLFAIAPVVEAPSAEAVAGKRLQSPLLFWTAFGILAAAIGTAAFFYGVHVGKSQFRPVAQSPAPSTPQANAPIDAGTSVPAAPGAIETQPIPDEMHSPPSGAVPVASRPILNTSKPEAASGSAQQAAGKDGIGKAASTPHPAQASDGGNAELAAAMAQLNGDNGSRDTSSAIRLLWAAVRKGNIEAEVTLADLYLYGDGVQQNCDQGRTLLMAASKSGDAQAKVKLDELNANGCP